MKPEISIIIPCYNRSKMLRECIDSFLKQTFKDFEIIIGDDGSEENLIWVVNLDPRIKYIKFERNGYGADRIRNYILQGRNSKYILQFDSDDLAKPNLLEEEYNFLNTHKECDCVYSDAIIKNTKTKVKEKCIFEDCNNTKEDYERMLHHQFIPHSTMWRKNKMLLHDENLPAAGDWELFLSGMEKGIKFYHLKKFLWIQRVGHEREAYGKRQEWGCNILLAKRGYKFDKETRTGIKI